MGFSRQEYWGVLPGPPAGDLLDQGIEPVSLSLLHWQAEFFTTNTTWEAQSSPFVPAFILGLFTCSFNGLPGCSLIAQSVQNLPAVQETQFNPWVRRIPWRREWEPTPMLLAGESHGQRKQPGGLRSAGSGTTEQLTLSLYTFRPGCLWRCRDREGQ